MNFLTLIKSINNKNRFLALVCFFFSGFFLYNNYCLYQKEIKIHKSRYPQEEIKKYPDLRKLEPVDFYILHIFILSWLLLPLVFGASGLHMLINMKPYDEKTIERLEAEISRLNELLEEYQGSKSPVF
ncbi:MAG: hypothetical protein H7196_00980 [candidate division SR1 bacterium]|nr:hypothetical protein [candidate division SR1 bacterium]